VGAAVSRRQARWLTDRHPRMGLRGVQPAGHGATSTGAGWPIPTSACRTNPDTPARHHPARSAHVAFLLGADTSISATKTCTSARCTVTQ
jgi:hypothetical protein